MVINTKTSAINNQISQLLAARKAAKQAKPAPALDIIEPKRTVTDANKTISDNIRQIRAHSEELKAERKRHQEQMQSTKEMIEAQKELMRILRLVMQIASRIMRGDNVPQGDVEFLLEHSPGMYQIAMSCRNYDNENPKDHRALARDNDGSQPSQPCANPLTSASSGVTNAVLLPS